MPCNPTIRPSAVGTGLAYRGAVVGGVDVLLDGHDAEFCLVSSAWILTPSSKFRLNQSSQATTMVLLGRTRAVSSF